MKYLYSVIKKNENENKNEKLDCNYKNNYYGDQLCKNKE